LAAFAACEVVDVFDGVFVVFLHLFFFESREE
jgi:hypothetical protein